MLRVAQLALAAFLLLLDSSLLAESPKLRVASYNIAMYRKSAGQLADNLRGGNDQQAKKIAAVIQRVRPDILLLCEIDYDPENQPVKLFVEQYLAKPQGDLEPINYPHRFHAPVNTGVPTGIDLNRDGKNNGPNDCYGYGRYPGQYGMAVLSRWPINEQKTRTFQKFKWSDLPDARRPIMPDSGQPYYNQQAWELMRLSSKSLWDIVIDTPKVWPGSRQLHLICSHPTPPVFDGPEDKNGTRNADEVRLVVDYITPGQGDYLVDDRGTRGQLAEGEPFVVLGDLNMDPLDGDGIRKPICDLLTSDLVVNDITPKSPGAVAASHATPQLNVSQTGDPALDTGDFGGDGHSNLRIDYALPSRNLKVLGTGVHWPAPGETGADEVKASDHRLVWVDIWSE